MTSKDTTLKNLLKTNEMWAQAVADADPEFFRRSAEGQSPQVSPHLPSLSRRRLSGFLQNVCTDGFRTLLSFAYVIILAFDRCCGLVVRIRGFRSPLSRVPSPETCSSIGTSPSTSNRGFISYSQAHDKLDR